MQDDKSRKPLDSSQINLNETEELRYWVMELGVSIDQLKEAVKQVGTSASAVRRNLRNNGNNNAPSS